MKNLLVIVLLLSASIEAAEAQSSQNVLVVINDASPASQRVGEHYIRARGIPDANVVRLRTSDDEEISRALFSTSIEQPISNAMARGGLYDRILYIVLTKGVPLRITGTEGLEGTVSSVDSELTVLYRRLTGVAVPVRGPVDNPYFLGARNVAEAKRFTHREHDIFLVTRLDGFTVDDAIAVIDRAQRPTADGKIVLDLKSGTEPGGDSWLRAAARRLEEMGAGDRVVLEASETGARNVDSVLGYSSWGSNDPANRARSYGMRFVPGSIAATFVSSDGRTFQPPPAGWRPSGNWVARNTWHAGTPQSLIGDLIRDGVTAVAGHVAEPFLQSTIRPQILFPAYLSGFNVAEAFYLAMPHLSWQTIVVGDPLGAPFQRAALSGDDFADTVDPITDLPAAFSRRRVAGIAASLKTVPLEAAALLARAESRFAKRDLAEAADALQKAAALAPSIPGVHIQLAVVNEERGEYDAAIAGYRQVLTTQPDHLVALNNLAFGLAVRKNDPKAALPLAMKAAALAPNEAAILDTLAWVHHLLGNNQEAIRLLQQALRLGTNTGEIYFHAAVVHARLGARTEAEAALKRALDLDAALASREDVRDLQRALRGK